MKYNIDVSSSLVVNIITTRQCTPDFEKNMDSSLNLIDESVVNNVWELCDISENTYVMFETGMDISTATDEASSAC